MDEAGWVSVSDITAHLNLNDQDLELATLYNNKSRFEIRDGMIRASQGHSLEEIPVTQEALEASWKRYQGEGSIWHGTNHDVIDSIRRGGILRGDRSHVHLASSVESHVGKRHNVSVLVEVSQELLREAGYEIFISPNRVVLARYIPANCIINVWELES